MGTNYSVIPKTPPCDNAFGCFGGGGLWGRGWPSDLFTYFRATGHTALSTLLRSMSGEVGYNCGSLLASDSPVQALVTYSVSSHKWVDWEVDKKPMILNQGSQKSEREGSLYRWVSAIS